MTEERLKSLSLKGKKVLVRVDFNVPLDEIGKITDDRRLIASLPTIRYLLSEGAYPILLSHLGRPQGKKDKMLSLAPCAKRLAELLGTPVVMGVDSIGEKVKKQIDALKPNETLLLENLRFYQEETKPSEDSFFAKELAKLGDCYVNDAFGTAHRAHSSTYTLPKLFTGPKAPGFLLEKELKYLKHLFERPKRPLYALIGGAKISTKFGLLRAIAEKVDELFVGGAMAYTLLKAKGVQVGRSLVEEDFLEEAKEILNRYSITLPTDHICVDKIDTSYPPIVATNEEGIPSHLMGVDIGPKTIQAYKQHLSYASTIFWNGPMGVFEHPPFDLGTKQIAQHLSQVKGIVVVGGGDSVAAINQLNLSHGFAHLSTGGGAALELIEGGHLPALEALGL